MTVSILAKGIADLEKYFAALPEIAGEAVALAINDVSSKKGMTLIRKTMRSQIAFPKGYLERDGRLMVHRKATRGRLEATIRGRDRATSLARFALPGQVGINNRHGIKVMVQPGKVRTMRRAFMMKLNSGNVGLAMRLNDGEEPSHTQGAFHLGDKNPRLKNLWLFYGPSVDQVFADVAEDVKPPIGDMIEKEFLRQFARLVRRG